MYLANIERETQQCQYLQKKALVEAFGKVLVRKPFKKITISDITDECGISRMTFYYHFKDIHALLEWALETQFTEAIRGNFTYKTWKQGFLNVFYFALANKEYILKIYPEFEKKYLEDYMHGIAQKIIKSVIEAEAEGKNIKESDIAFMSDMYAYIFVGAIVSWVNSEW